MSGYDKTFADCCKQCLFAFAIILRQLIYYLLQLGTIIILMYVVEDWPKVMGHEQDYVTPANIFRNALLH